MWGKDRHSGHAFIGEHPSEFQIETTWQGIKGGNL